MLSNSELIKQKFHWNLGPKWNNWVGQEKIREAVDWSWKRVYKRGNDASRSAEEKGFLHWPTELGDLVTEKGSVCERW